ncbi:MAG: 50S ribosomal protein L11 methyltransferase [Rubricoccaceae bacterium]
MTATVALTLRPTDDLREWAIAELADLGFDAFEEGADGALVAYAPAARWDDTAREHLAAWLDAHGLSPAEEHLHPPENWNARWEATIQPRVAGSFLIAPTWADVPEEHAHLTLLRIDPKMAFGTGYHPSTRLVLRLLPPLVPPGGRVLDVGTGTGILAIAALRAGAAEALGVDIDPWAVVNGEENAHLNGVADRFVVREGSLEAADEGPFGLVLANIIRAVLLPMLPALAARLEPGGALVLAGLLQAERDEVCAALAAAGLTLHSEASEEEWWACAARRDA